jgi:hypothetical protein
MFKRVELVLLFAALLVGAAAFAQGPCSAQSSKLACVIPQEYGPGGFSTAAQGVFAKNHHEGHFDNSIGSLLGPVTQEIGRQANLLPLASPSSGVILTYDSSLKTYVASTNSLGPVLGERAETVGRHRLFIGFSYQFFDFDKIDSVNLHQFPAIFTHAEDKNDDNPGKDCGIAANQGNLNGCAFVRDLISSVNSIDLKVNQYTTYVTFGLTRRIDVSAVIPVENVRMKLLSSDTILLGTDGTYPNPVEDISPGRPHFDHLFFGCTDEKNPKAHPECLNHVFPDSSFTSGGSTPKNSASGIGDLVARVKWNAWHGERAGVSVGLDVRFPSGDELNYLGSGSYGVKPFAIFSYRASISPHVLIGYEWNSDSITAGDLAKNIKGKVPSDLAYSAGADVRVTKWLTGSFDIVGQRVFNTETLSVTSQDFLAPCGMCTSMPTPNTVSQPNLIRNPDTSYSITNASMGIKLRPLPKISKLVVTANVLVRLDDGGLHSKPAPLIGLGYTF